MDIPGIYPPIYTQQSDKFSAGLLHRHPRDHQARHFRIEPHYAIARNREIHRVQFLRFDKFDYRAIDFGPLWLRPPSGPRRTSNFSPIVNFGTIGSCTSASTTRPSTSAASLWRGVSRGPQVDHIAPCRLAADHRHDMIGPTGKGASALVEVRCSVVNSSYADAVANMP